MKKLLLILFSCLIIFGSNSSPVFADDPIPTPSADEVNAIAKNMFCPVCENIPLDVCGTTACGQWRAQINEKLSLGWDDQQIYDYFVSLYGDRVLAAPPKKGLNWLIYVLPPLLILVAVIAFYRKGKTWRHTNGKSEIEEIQPNEDEKSDIQNQIEIDLTAYD